MTENGREKGEAVLIAALACGDTIREAAAKAGVSERTAHRRWSDENFRQKVNQAWSELIRQSVGKLAEASSRAVMVLNELLNADSENVRLSAARTIIDQCAKFSEFAHLEQRVINLETVLGMFEKNESKKARK